MNITGWTKTLWSCWKAFHWLLWKENQAPSRKTDHLGSVSDFQNCTYLKSASVKIMPLHPRWHNAIIFPRLSLIADFFFNLWAKSPQILFLSGYICWIVLISSLGTVNILCFLRSWRQAKSRKINIYYTFLSVQGRL